MNLLLFRHNWGLEVSSWEEKLRKIKQAGFAGVETGTVHAADYGHFRDLLAQYKLRFLPQVFTHGVTVAEHVGSFRRQLLALREFRPICINCHSGCDGWAHDMATRFYREVLSIEADAGIPVAHETHRDRCFYNPWSTARLLQTFSRLRICADFSHWVCVCERLLTTEEDILRECARRTIHIHARIGYENGPQVPDPRAPEWQAHVEAHEKWWTWIWEAQRKRGSPETTLTPEFGLPSCLHTLPYTQAPVAEFRTPPIVCESICDFQGFFPDVLCARVRTQTCPLFCTSGMVTGYACPPRGRLVSRSSQPGKSACYQ